MESKNPPTRPATGSAASPAASAADAGEASRKDASQSELSRSYPSRSKAPSRGTPDIRVLVVDDETRNLKIVGEILKRDGIRFIFATSAQEALEAARATLPTVILMDIMMPGCDGFAACDLLKADAATASIPIVFLTAKAEPQDLVRGFAKGGADYITKPFCAEELLARVHSQIDLHLLRRDLSETCRRRAELITTLAHDIKNPAGAIYSLAEMVLEDMESPDFDLEETRSLIRLIDESGRRMFELVDDVLDEARREDGHTSVREGALVDPRGLIEELVALNSVHGRKSGVRLALESDFKVRINMSRRILTELFDNLISNAVKFSRPGGTVEISLRALEGREGWLRFEVCDEAPLLNEEQRRGIFDKFARGGEAGEAMAEQSSHGVGLAIVKRLTSMHGGEVGFRTRNDGLGNCFYIELPYR